MVFSLYDDNICPFLRITCNVYNMDTSRFSSNLGRYKECYFSLQMTIHVS